MYSSRPYKAAPQIDPPFLYFVQKAYGIAAASGSHAKPFCEVLNGFLQTYYGGATNIEYSDERSCFYRVRYPGDGEEPDRAAIIETEKAGTDTSLKAGSDSLGRDCNWSYVDDTYYILMDDSGFFLRTYDKGEEEEEIVYAFSMN